MKIEDKIYIPHICLECSTVRLIPRDTLHDKPEIICSECGGVMRRWVVHTPAPQPRFSDKTLAYLLHTQAQTDITGTPWNPCHGSSLADVRKQMIYDDLVDHPGPPEMIYLESEVRAAELRAAHMGGRLEDIIVTLVCEISYDTGGKSLRVESVPHSQLHGRIQELHDTVVDGKVRVWIAYSEETSQVFVLNGLEIDEEPRLPGYGQEYDKKRTGFRSPSSGVNL